MALRQRVSLSRCLQPPCLWINRNHHWVRDIRLRFRGNGHLVAERGQRLRACGDILAVVQLKRRRFEECERAVSIGVLVALVMLGREPVVRRPLRRRTCRNGCIDSS